MASSPSSTSLADVARRAGVSQTTASRFFNEPAKLREVTRRRIERVVRELDFVPSAAARALATRRSRTIGAVIPTLDHALFSREINHMADRLAEDDHALILASGNYEPDQELERVRTMLSRGVDGLLLVGLLRDPEVYRLLDSRSVPYVTTWTIDPESPHPQVGVDYRAAARDMARHHLDSGHVEFGLIDLPARHNDRSTSRRDGCREAIEAGGGRLRAECIVECPIDFAEGGRALEVLMDRPTPPTAILCGGDVFALGALMAASRRRLVVPRDVSISGFDNHGMSAMMTPSLTTIELPIRETGVAAAQYLLDRIAGRSVEHRALFGHRVLARDSTAAPPGLVEAETCAIGQ